MRTWRPSFFEHFLYIAEAMTDIGGVELWDEQEEFFFDVLDLPDGRRVPLKIHSIVGLIPLFAVETIEPELLKKMPNFLARMKWFSQASARTCVACFALDRTGCWQAGSAFAAPRAPHEMCDPENGRRREVLFGLWHSRSLPAIAG